MEGKEVRFGIATSALFAVITTAASCGAVNAMHDCFTPLGGMIPLINMQLGEVIVGGVGAGLYGMLLFVIIAIFVAGLMVGRTPEYLGKKIEAKEVKMAMLAILVLPLMYARLDGRRECAAVGGRLDRQSGTARLHRDPLCLHLGPANNGSAFAGLTGNTPFYNMTLGIAMFVGPLPRDHPGAGDRRLARGEEDRAGLGRHVPDHGGLFVGLLVGVILIVGGLTFFPALALGPIVEHLAMIAGQTFSSGS